MQRSELLYLKRKEQLMSPTASWWHHAREWELRFDHITAIGISGIV